MLGTDLGRRPHVSTDLASTTCVMGVLRTASHLLTVIKSCRECCVCFRFLCMPAVLHCGLNVPTHKCCFDSICTGVDHAHDQ